LLFPFFLQEYGNAITDILMGDVNPSAKLPLTMPNIENEVNFTQSDWPGINKVATYSEHLLVGYRWYAAHGAKPAFAFGHGLSSTTFTYSNLRTDDDDGSPAEEKFLLGRHCKKHKRDRTIRIGG
jgi:beta-glucosidase